MATARRLAAPRARARGRGSRGHVLIAGPGRAGTTLLVKLLGELGLDTGSDRLAFHAGARAGLESSVLSPDAPHVVKSPKLTTSLGALIESGRLDPRQVEWLIVPLRPLADAAASRVRVSVEQRGVRNVPGGLVGTMRPARQQRWLAESTYGLFETAARYEIPLVVLQYPQFVSDPEYAFRRLRPLLGDRDHAAFAAAWNSVVDPALVNAGPVEMPRLATLRTAPWRLRTVAELKWWGARRRLERLRPGR